MPISSAAVNCDVFLAGKEVEDSLVMSFSIDRDLDQPDMAVVVLKNPDHSQTKAYKPGDVVEIKADKELIYKGEVVGLEPIYKAGGETRLVLRCFNKLHRMLRGKKSVTYSEQTDGDIVSKLAGDHGLSADFKGPKVKYKVVYQHNQSDLEFLRVRAARIGCRVWVEGDKLFCKQPELDKDSGITLELDADTNTEFRLKAFMPRMSSASVVKKVTVRGWDPEKKEAITGEASIADSPLGSSNASKGAGELGTTETFAVDYPIWSADEAKAIAEARLQELTMAYITGEAECVGSSKFAPGIVVKVIVNPAAEDKFNGKYFITGVTHRYANADRTGDGGFTSHLRVARNAEVGKKKQQ